MGEAWTVATRRPSKAADVSDDGFLGVVAGRLHERMPNFGLFPHPGLSQTWYSCDRWTAASRLGFPEKVVLAKARSLIRRGLLEGCGCGCRGDFRPTAAGFALIGVSP